MRQNLDHPNDNSKIKPTTFHRSKNTKEVDETNEKFAFRTWLTRLGMNGKDLRAERNILYRNLSGHTAFRTDKDEEKWKARQAAKRAELKALKAAAKGTV